MENIIIHLSEINICCCVGIEVYAMAQWKKILSTVKKVKKSPSSDDGGAAAVAAGDSKSPPLKKKVCNATMHD